ncbi:unnamed protein product [Blepharisma stoltei]|uniref:NADP-dependent oxidoreductase domain-containing protein n=1 Tax=Blepharisma stoltei TaxID=1481888 RepID=A0AAU9K267_9CILI|nr:unnamed protein product [Blepharisma stoltei]
MALRYRRLRSGAMMPIIGFGTYKLKGEECYNAVKSAVLDAGYRHIDTATMYKNEADIGRALKDIFASGIRREDLFITTKLWCSDHSPERISQKFQESLDSLGLDYIDLYLIHKPFSVAGCEDYPNGDTFELSYIPTTAVWAELEKLVDRGLIIDLGISNVPAALLLEIYSSSRIKPSVVQNELHPYNTSENIIKFCKKLGIQYQGYGSLGGFNYKHDHQLTPLIEHPVIQEIALKYGKSCANILLNWSLSQEACIIPKSAQLERQIENLTAIEYKMEEDDIKRISQLNQNLRFYGVALLVKAGIPLYD